MIAGVTKLRKTAVQSITSGAWRDVTWDVEDYDNLGAVSLGTSAINIVVPSGITLMLPMLRAAWVNATGGRYFNLTDGTTNFLDDSRNAVNEALASLCSGWVDVTASATLKLQANSGGTTRNLGNATYGGYPELTILWASSWSSIYS